MSGLNQEETDKLRKRACRRLIGAFVLLLIALGLVWASFHKEPYTSQPTLIQVVSSEASKETMPRSTMASDVAIDENPALILEEEDSAITPKSTVSTVAEKPSKPQLPQPKSSLEKRTATYREKAPSKINMPLPKKEKKPPKTQGRILIQLGAFTNPQALANLKQKLIALGIYASFSTIQTSQGKTTRVRVGPFSDLAAANRMLKKLQQHGLSGTVLP